jgi:gentisate 1,2-dioxygenase
MGEARFVNYEEATRGIAKKKLRGTIWKWKEVVARLQAIDADARVSAARRIVGLVDGDTGELMGTTPSSIVGPQLVKPGEHIEPHRHTFTAINIVMQGSGYSVVDGEKIEREQGDTFTTPAWSFHEHYNTGADDAIIYSILDIPLMASQRTLLLEEPAGSPAKFVVLP